MSCFSFNIVQENLPSLSSQERKDQLLQYNLNENLIIVKYRFNGNLSKTSSDYEQVIMDLFNSAHVLKTLGVIGSSTVTFQSDMQNLLLSVMNMEFFDKLLESGYV